MSADRCDFDCGAFVARRYTVISTGEVLYLCADCVGDVAHAVGPLRGEEDD